MEKVLTHTFWSTNGLLLGRIFMGLLFFLSGIYKLQGGVDGVESMIANAGLPIPIVLAWATIIVEFSAGAMLIFGYKVRHAAFALIVFVAIASAFFHADFTDMNLLKNLAIIGGLIYVMAYGTGKTWTLGKE